MNLDDCTADLEGDVLSVFLTDTPRQIQRLREAAKTHDMTLLKATAHYLKGGALYLGARKFSELCSQLEAISENSRAVNAIIIIENLETEFATIEQGK